MLNILSRWIKWGLMLAWVLAMLIIGAKFAQQNQDLVQLKLLYWQLPERTSGLVFGCTLLLGVVLGMLAFVPGYMALKLRLKRLQKKHKKLEQTPHPVTLPKAE